MASVEHVLSGYGAPTSVPPSLAAHYIDLSSGRQWNAHGTGSSEDWRPQGDALYAVFSGAEVHDVPPGVSHVRVIAEGAPETITINVPRPPEGSRFVTSIDVEITQVWPNFVGSQVIAAPGVGFARIVGGGPLGASITVDDAILIPSRVDPWQALLRVVVSESELMAYVLAFEEFP
ncbi:hypothetical protein [Stutzerimonas stutzeri]|uniref:hypothetical protein n=1 Tax=Stutzerimonas stutzeri TaxID=316 RepID=UPI00265852E8|nr:hypothetical protein [Stutzerimonas stutzeri]MCF6780934.1 hypothetical protein [Stutzerimonas stutzeri]MCF6803503.1 hypothetical protein [Stutzerimonas stutzeri]